MNIVLFISIFIAGTVFGSFFSLAVYRLPRKENITYVRSHCTFCNHDLNSLDLIPVWSYIFLRGKCRYCKEKIRSRYILLEVFSGLVFILIALSLKINAYSSIYEFINLFFIYLFVCSLFIIGGIDKENNIIHDGTLVYGIVISLLYGLFKSFYNESMFDNIVGFLAIPTIVFAMISFLRLIEDDNKLPVGFGDIKYMAMIGLFLGFAMQIIALILAVVMGVFVAIINKKKEIPLGYYLSVASVMVIIFNSLISPVINLINMNIA